MPFLKLRNLTEFWTLAVVLSLEKLEIVKISTNRANLHVQCKHIQLTVYTLHELIHLTRWNDNFRNKIHNCSTDEENVCINSGILLIEITVMAAFPYIVANHRCLSMLAANACLVSQQHQ